MKDLTCGSRKEIAARSDAPMWIKQIKTSNQPKPRLLNEVVKFFRPALLLATGCAVGQTEVFKHLLIAPRNAGGQHAAGFLPQVTL